jgi:hypothetical protein
MAYKTNTERTLVKNQRIHYVKSQICFYTYSMCEDSHQQLGLCGNNCVVTRENMNINYCLKQQSTGV